MADDKTKKGKPDCSRTNTREPYELQYWKTKFGLTGQAIAGAVRAVGSSEAKKVEAYLKCKR